MAKKKRKPYQCPACGSSETRYRPTLKSFICRRCGTEFTSKYAHKRASKLAVSTKPKRGTKV